jgi:hypothetical protein
MEAEMDNEKFKGLEELDVRRRLKRADPLRKVVYQVIYCWKKSLI